MFFTLLTAVLVYYKAKVCFILVLIHLPHMIDTLRKYRTSQTSGHTQRMHLQSSFMELQYGTVIFHFPLVFVKIGNEEKITRQTATRLHEQAISF